MPFYFSEKIKNNINKRDLDFECKKLPFIDFIMCSKQWKALTNYHVPRARAKGEKKMHYISSEKTIGTIIEVQLSSLNLGGYLRTKPETVCLLELAPSTIDMERS